MTDKRGCFKTNLIGILAGSEFRDDGYTTNETQILLDFNIVKDNLHIFKLEKRKLMSFFFLKGCLYRIDKSKQMVYQVMFALHRTRL